MNRSVVATVAFEGVHKEINGRKRFIGERFATFRIFQQKTVSIFGAGKRIELWNPEAFAEIEAEMEDLDDLGDFDFSAIDY